MSIIKECLELNEVAALQRGLLFLETEYAELLQYEVQINEDTENTLNAILNDIEDRISEAKSRLNAASRASDPAVRRAAKSRAMSDLNRTRGLLDKVVKQFFPETPDDDEPVRKNDEFISPRQAAETLGITTGQLQSLVMSNKLHMHNDGGRWALKGSEVQALADAPKTAPAPKRFGDALRNTSFGRHLSSLIK